MSTPAKELPTAVFAPRAIMEDTPTVQRMVLFYDQLHLLAPVSRNAKAEAESQAMADLNYLREQRVAVNVGPEIPRIGFGFTNGAELSLQELIAPDIDAFIPFRFLGDAEPLYEGEPQDNRRLRHVAQYFRPPASDFTTIALAAAPPVTGTGAASSHLLEIAIQELALPPDDIPWQDLIEYRRSPEHLRELAALRRWLRRVSRGTATPNELREELRDALDRYRAMAQSAHHRTVVGNWSVVIGLASLAAEPGIPAVIAALSALVGVRAQRPDPSLEAAAPGREVAYLYNTEQWLGQQRRGRR